MKLSFDTQDERVKTGMTVSVSIITDVKTDVLVVPNGAVKSQNGGGSYVEMFPSTDSTGSPQAGSGQVILPAEAFTGQGFPSTIAPRQQNVTTGLSNDTMTEIVDGLKEGDNVVTRTIAATTATTATAPSLFGGGGNKTSGGGAVRALGR